MELTKLILKYENYNIMCFYNGYKRVVLKWKVIDKSGKEIFIPDVITSQQIEDYVQFKIKENK